MSDGEILAALARIENAQIAAAELKMFGHRIVYDIQSGWSKNVGGFHVKPSLLDHLGYQVRYDDYGTTGISET